MTATSDIDDRAKSWALPLSEAELRAWDALPREEQVGQLRALLQSEACQTISTRSFDEIVDAARKRPA